MRVRLLRTGDEEIDRYKGRIGTVVKIEPSELPEYENDDNYNHYHVEFTNLKSSLPPVVFVVNNAEFEIIED